MKYSCLLLSIILFTISCKKTNSTQNDNVLPDNLNAWVKIPFVTNEADGIWFTDQNKGFLISLRSGIFSSSDGGLTWDSIPNTVPVMGYNIQFIDSLHGFAQGEYLWASNDGGKSWTQRSTTNYALNIQFLNLTTGFYTNAVFGMSSTQNSGITWDSILTPAPVSYPNPDNYPFYFLDSLRGFSMMNGNFQKTVDGGKNWEIISSLPDVLFTGFNKMQFLDELTGYCSSLLGLLKTTDGGKSWVNCFGMRYSAYTIYQSPQFFDRDNGYFMMGNGIYRTRDGGKTWETSCTISGGGFSSIYFLDINTGWATTYNGYILKLKL